MSTEEKSMFDNSTMSIGSNDDFNSHISDFDGMGSSWFSSLMSKKLWDFEVGSSDISVYSFNEEKNDLLSCDLNSENVLETADFDDFDTDGPLFWPFERKFDWNSNVKWDFICISPRKNGGKVATNSDGVSAPNSIRLSLHKRKKDLKDGSKKRLLCRSKSVVVSTELEGKTKAVNDKLLRISTMPNSRLSKSSSTQDFMENKPPDIKDNNEFLGDFKALLEESYFVSNNEISIEKLVGLNEFDGHEGVGEEFGEEYHLILDESFGESSRISRFSEKKRCGSLRERKRAR
ncbi:hypothetical protein BVC80_1713g30 [Macleaya cordata]|uniref:Uncharacterized protein n=1 Tax=Macleaya cordata TaxID=56857 RepID=A0A200Q2C7_MACCD|nr:hypothetical protein BVC80_1713g30 [Macleaya cordata]